MKKMIKVDMNTWKALMYLRIEKGYSSIDAVLQDLLQNYQSSK